MDLAAFKLQDFAYYACMWITTVDGHTCEMHFESTLLDIANQRRVMNMRFIQTRS
jgi:hypothetical protein